MMIECEMIKKQRMGQRETLTAYKKNPNYGSKKKSGKKWQPNILDRKKKEPEKFPKKKKKKRVRGNQVALCTMMLAMNVNENSFATILHSTLFMIWSITREHKHTNHQDEYMKSKVIWI